MPAPAQQPNRATLRAEKAEHKRQKKVQAAADTAAALQATHDEAVANAIADGHNRAAAEAAMQVTDVEAVANANLVAKNKAAAAKHKHQKTMQAAANTAAAMQATDAEAAVNHNLVAENNRAAASAAMQDTDVQAAANATETTMRSVAAQQRRALAQAASHTRQRRPFRKAGRLLSETEDDLPSQCARDMLMITCSHCHALLLSTESEYLCCQKGKVVLAPLSPAPPDLLNLHTTNHAFVKDIRKHNSQLAFTSSKSHSDASVAPHFKVQGRLHHRGTTSAISSGVQMCAQLCIHDGTFETELQNRLQWSPELNEEHMRMLQHALHAMPNPCTALFRTA